MDRRRVVAIAGPVPIDIAGIAWVHRTLARAREAPGIGGLSMSWVHGEWVEGPPRCVRRGSRSP